MENRKRTNLISVLIILLCLSLCVGATYAYFTDSVTSTGNKIKAGKLDIDLELLDKETGNWNSIKTSQAPIFNYNLWEPGYTDVKLLKVENEGNLAIKWEARLVTEGTLNALADEIEVYVTTSNGEMNFPADLNAVKGWTKVGTLRTFFANTGINGTLEATKASYFAIALHLPTTVENTNAQGVELQNLALPEFDIQIVATQYTHESDAFDENYDKDAKFPCNHTNVEVLDAVPADCENIGLTEGKKCSDCGEVIVVQTTVDALGHNYESTVILPTATENGSIENICSNCGDTEFITAIVPTDFSVTKDNRSMVGYKGVAGEELVIPAVFYDEENDTWYRVTSIDRGAFFNCDDLVSITIPASITTIGIEAFLDCDALTNIIVDENNTAYQSIGGNFYSKDGTVLITYAKGKSDTSFTIPDGVTRIYDSALFGCRNLESIIIPSSVNDIGGEAFADCIGLQYIAFGGTVQQWNDDVALQFFWSYGVPATYVQCSDGIVELN